MKRNLTYLFNAFYWFVFASAIIIVLLASEVGQKTSAPFGKVQFITITIIVVPSIVSFYSAYYFLFSKYIKTRSVSVLLAHSLLIAVATALFGLAITSLLIGNQFTLVNNVEAFTGRVIFILVISLLNMVAGFVLKGFISWYGELKVKEELQQKAQVMELSLIESKLAPHFLFNTINNIGVLVLRDSKAAADYLNKLSSILRFTLYEPKEQKIQLSKELDYILKYIELQKIRTANQTFISIEIRGEYSDLLIYPMTFVPFIENAFKHSTNKKLEEAIKIVITITENQVHFICKNKFKPAATKSGIGNELIVRRLELLYPSCHSLDIDKNETIYTVNLKIEL